MNSCLILFYMYIYICAKIKTNLKILGYVNVFMHFQCLGGIYCIAASKEIFN